MRWDGPKAERLLDVIYLEPRIYKLHYEDHVKDKSLAVRCQQRCAELVLFPWSLSVTKGCRFWNDG